MSNPFSNPFSPVAPSTGWPLSIQVQGQAIRSAIDKYNVPPQVFMGMYNNETALGTNVANSSANAVGPFQFLPSTASSYGYPLTNRPNVVEFQAQANGAAHYLSDLFNQLGHDWTKALAGYNAGPGNIGAGMGYANQAMHFQIPAAWAAVVGSGGATGVTPGGTAGGGGSGALLNDIANFQVGSSMNPNEDFWTAINRLAMERYWYSFSDGETFYLADGDDLMKQTPAVTIDRFKDLPRINHLDWVWDNTAWSYTTTHKRRRRTQRRSILAHVTSPVEGQLNLISEIDEIRAGDVITLSGAGPADGNWLVATCRRSVFQVWSEITLVPALHPLLENQVAGVNPLNPGGATPRAPGSGQPFVSSAGFTFPFSRTASGVVSQGSWTKDQGVDIAAPGHTQLLAVADGQIWFYGIGGFGPYAIVLRLDSPLGSYNFVYYGHAGPGNEPPIGTKVKAGQVIGEVGAGIFGISTGPHLEIGFCDNHGTPTPGSRDAMYNYLIASHH